MMHILLIGTDLPLLEGLAQTFASLGLEPVVAQSITEGRELAAQHPPLVVLVSRELATTGAEALTIPLARGGARLLYRPVGSQVEPYAHAVQRSVLADLTLPLERNRLVALVQHVEQRARVTGHSDDPSSHPAAPA
jgi:DNA-binding NtrC family response regulator